MKLNLKVLKTLKRRKSKPHPYLLLLPAFLFILIFQLFPLLQAIYVSFLDLKPATWKVFFTRFTAPFMGLKNYKFIATGSNGVMAEIFAKSVLNTFWYVVIVSVLCLAIGLVLAIALNRKFKLSNMTRIVLFLPFVMPAFLLESAWDTYFNKDYGVLNKIIFEWLHLVPYRIDWFSEGKVLWVMIIITVWHYLPLWTIFLLSGIQNINNECYEAAGIDGAGHLRKFYYITLPLLRPVIAILIFLGLILNVYYSYKIFEWDAVSYYMYRHFFRNWFYGTGTAGTIMIMIAVILTVLLWYGFFKEDLSASDEVIVRKKFRLPFVGNFIASVLEHAAAMIMRLDIGRKLRRTYRAICNIWLKIRSSNFIWFVLWSLTLLFGFKYLTTGSGHESLWFDESYSAAVSKHTIPEIWNITIGDSHPPLYFMILRIFTLVFGRTEASLRLLSVVGIILLAALGMGPIRRAFGKFTGWIYGAIVLIVPMSLSMGQEARMYTLAAFFVTGAAVYGYLCQEKGKIFDFVMLGAFSVGAAYTHYFSLLAVTIANVLLFLQLIIRFEKKRFFRYIVMAVVAVGCYFPWIVALTGQISKVAKDFWIPPVTRGVVWQALIYPFKAKFTSGFEFILPSFFLAVAFAFWGVKQAFTERKREGLLSVYAILIYVTTLAVAVKVSTEVRPIFVDRYIFPVVGLFILATAYGVSKIKYRDISVLVVVLLLLFSLDPIRQINEHRYSGPMFEVRNYLDDTITSDDVFIHSDEHTFGTFSYYFPDNRHYLYLRPGFKGYSSYSAFSHNGEAGSDIEGFVTGKEKVWVVERQNSDTSVYRWLLTNGKLKCTIGPEFFNIDYSWYGVILRKVEWKNE